MATKKEMIRVKLYSQLTGITTQQIHNEINDETLPFEMIGGIRHVPYPDEALIKFKPVKEKKGK